MTLITDKKETTVRCGKCGKKIESIKLKRPRAISDYDEIHGIVRDHSFNCCGRTWLMNQKFGPVDYGTELK